METLDPILAKLAQKIEAEIPGAVAARLCDSAMSVRLPLLYVEDVRVSLWWSTPSYEHPALLGVKVAGYSDLGQDRRRTVCLGLALEEAKVVAAVRILLYKKFASLEEYVAAELQQWQTNMRAEARKQSERADFLRSAAEHQLLAYDSVPTEATHMWPGPQLTGSRNSAIGLLEDGKVSIYVSLSFAEAGKLLQLLKDL